MWQRDFPGVYAALAVDWSENVGYIMQALLGELSSNRYLAQLPEQNWNFEITGDVQLHNTKEA